MSKFIERHKRKSLSALLFLLLRGKAKVILVMLVVAGVSTPFVVSSDSFAKMLQIPAVSAFLKTVGLDGVMSRLNPNYAGYIKSALEGASADTRDYSVWQRLVNGFGGAAGGAGAGYDAKGTGTVGMVRAGDGFYDSKGGKGGRAGRDDIRGAMNDDERSAEGEPDAMNFEDMLAMGGEGAGGRMKDMGFGNGGWGSNSYGGGMGYGPYMNKDYLGGKGGSVPSKGSGAVNSALNSTAVPDLKTRSVKKTGRMGMMSGFSWRNVGYRSKGANVTARISSNRRALFQASETFAMTVAAAKSESSAPEHRAAYTGSTYDGNPVGGDVVTVPGDPISVPDTGFVDDLINSADDWAQLAQDCADSQEVEGTRIADNMKKIDDIMETMGNPPKCCNRGAVDRWNDKVKRMKELCIQVNADEKILSEKCQAASQQQDCNSYDQMKIKKCSKWKCWLGIILGVILMIIGAILVITGVGAAIGVALIIGGALLVVGQIVGGTFGAILSAVGALIGCVFGGLAAGLAIGAAAWATSQYGPEDGSNAFNN